MNKITYNEDNRLWYSEDGKVVHFRLKTLGYHLLRTHSFKVALKVKNVVYIVDSITDSRFYITTEDEKKLNMFEIDKGHPAYDFFKKEMERDGKYYLKPLDTPDNWQLY